MHFSTIYFTAAICVVGVIGAPTSNNALDVIHVGQLETRSSIDEQRKDIERLRREAERLRRLEEQARERAERDKKKAKDEERRAGIGSN